MCPMLGTSPSCIGECLVFSPGIDGEMVTSAISAASAFAIEQPVRVRKSRVFAQLGQIRERKNEKREKKSSALFSFPTVLTSYPYIGICILCCQRSSSVVSFLDLLDLRYIS